MQWFRTIISIVKRSLILINYLCSIRNRRDVLLMYPQFLNTPFYLMAQSRIIIIQFNKIGLFEDAEIFNLGAAPFYESTLSESALSPDNVCNSPIPFWRLPCMVAIVSVNGWSSAVALNFRFASSANLREM